MRFVIAPDSYKESMSAETAAKAIKDGLHQLFPDAVFDLFPMADGGEGTLSSIKQVKKEMRHLDVPVHDPVGRIILAPIGVLEREGIIVIEMAQASGLMLLEDDERNPWMTSSYGTGELVLKALEFNPKEIILGIGGSATNDGGIGFLRALGARILDQHQQPVDCGGKGLSQVHSIDLSKMAPKLKHTRFTVLYDVSNPLIGQKGSSFVFGPQKGADINMTKELELGMNNYAKVLESELGIHVQHLEGSGSAGGLGFALRVFSDVHFFSGIDYMMKLSGIEDAIKNADIVFTGEGSIDAQTLEGKVPAGIAKTAKKYGKPVVAMVGRINCDTELLNHFGISHVYSINNPVHDLKNALKNGSSNLKSAIVGLACEIKEILGLNPSGEHGESKR
ncbi:MAG: glycerate kinase [Acholeplasmataceae bacterium]|nr:glycerate kinase [Acholeplasmataceae bacterium]